MRFQSSGVASFIRLFLIRETTDITDKAGGTAAAIFYRVSLFYRRGLLGQLLREAVVTRGISLRPRFFLIREGERGGGRSRRPNVRPVARDTMKNSMETASGKPPLNRIPDTRPNNCPCALSFSTYAFMVDEYLRPGSLLSVEFRVIEILQVSGDTLPRVVLLLPLFFFLSLFFKPYLVVHIELVELLFDLKYYL